jgi:hypothetical protein
MLQGVPRISFMMTFNVKSNSNLNYKSKTDCDSVNPLGLWFKGLESNSFV